MREVYLKIQIQNLKGILFLWRLLCFQPQEMVKPSEK
jgi:hypothetical protein